MTEGLSPPYIEPTGPCRDDAEVLHAFARNEPPGYSVRLHVERPVLFVERCHELALRIGSDTVLVRVDHPDECTTAKEALENALLAEGNACLDEHTLLGLPAAFHLVGLRLSEWDLWGQNLEEAFADLRKAAVLEMPPILG